jgi:hypothetical protein
MSSLFRYCSIQVHSKKERIVSQQSLPPQEVERNVIADQVCCEFRDGHNMSVLKKWVEESLRSTDAAKLRIRMGLKFGYKNVVRIQETLEAVREKNGITGEELIGILCERFRAGATGSSC